MPDADSLPAYADALGLFHRAFARELSRAARAVPLAPGSRVLDVPCGDGFFTARLARRLHPFGAVVAADLSDAFLDSARRAVTRHDRLARVEFVKADAYELPFDDAAFDLVWCAQSLISLTDPVAALREMRRGVRPGGTVAVLEDDEYHRVLMNWGVDVELAVQRGVAAAARAKYGSAAGLSPSRRVGQWLTAAGLRPRGKKTFAADREAPFPPAVRRYLEVHLRQTRAFVAPHLSPRDSAALDRATHPTDPASVLTRPDAAVTCLTTLFLARRE